MCDKAFNKCFIAFIDTPDQYKTHEKCDRVIFEYSFLIRYVSDQYKAQ